MAENRSAWLRSESFTAQGTGRLLAWSLLALTLLPSCGVVHAVDRVMDPAGWRRYQEEIRRQARPVWPQRFKHGYAHYSGPMIEEAYFDTWSRTRPQLPQLYLPIGWSTFFFAAARVPPFNLSEVQRAKSEVEGLLERLEKKHNYFSVVQFAGLIRVEQLHIPCDLKLTLFVGGGPEDRLQAPHLRLVPIPLLSKVLRLRPEIPRRTLVSFVGGFLPWQDPGGIRSEMQALLANTSGYRISDRVPDWEDVMAGSVFHLCPRGNGPSSYRLYEALQAETIPIYIWDEVTWLAYEDKVDWGSIAIVLHRSEMRRIPDLVAAADPEVFRAAIRRSAHMWQYAYVVDYITWHIGNGTSLTAPHLDRPWFNSSDCRAAVQGSAKTELAMGADSKGEVAGLIAAEDQATRGSGALAGYAVVALILLAAAYVAGQSWKRQRSSVSGSIKALKRWLMRQHSNSNHRQRSPSVGSEGSPIPLRIKTGGKDGSSVGNGVSSPTYSRVGLRSWAGSPTRTPLIPSEP